MANKKFKSLVDLQAGAKLSALTADRVVVLDGSQDFAVSSVTGTELGYLSGVTSSIQTQLDAKIPSSEKGAVNGVATLDGGGKVPASQLPNSVMEYKGSFDPGTATFTDAGGNAGDVYLASAAGSYDAGSGSITYAIGDWAVHNGTIFEKSLNSDAVVSVNSQTGVVVLDADDIDDAATAHKFASQAQLDKVDFLTVTQAVDLDDVESKANSALQSGDNISSLTNDASYITSAGAPVQSVNTQTGAIILDGEDLDISANYATNPNTSGNVTAGDSIEDALKRLEAKADSGQTLTAGEGISFDGTDIDVNVDNSTIEISTDILRVKDGGITNSKLGNVSVDASKLASNAVETAKIQDGAVTEAKIGNDQVTSTKIADGNVTEAKLASSVNAATFVIEAGYDSSSATGNVTVGESIQASLEKIEKKADDAATSGAVDSVNSQTGVVVLDADDIDDGSTAHKFASQAQLDKVDFVSVTQAVDLDAMESDISTNASNFSSHTDGGANKHDASEIDYERVDGSKKNIQAASDDAESALTDLDDAIGSLAASPSNYSPTDAGIVADHLSAIDSALVAAGSDENVKVSANDTTPGSLEDKIVASDGTNSTNALEISTLNDAGDEDLQIQFDESKVDHDALLNFVSNEHIDHSSVSINTNADSGLSGGGDITASRTLEVDIAGTTLLAEVAANDDELLIEDTSAGAKKSVSVENIRKSSKGDILETSFSGAESASSASVTNLAFASADVRSFRAQVVVEIDATADLFEVFTLEGVQKASGFDMSVSSVGDDSSVSFSITSAGQVQYSSSTYAGFVSMSIKFRAETLSV